MAKKKEVKRPEPKAKAKKAQAAATADEGALKRSFAGKLKNKPASPKKAPPAEQPRKVMTSNFLSYIKCALKSQTQEVKDQAAYIADHYALSKWWQTSRACHHFQAVCDCPRAAQMLSGRGTSPWACS